MIRRHLRIPSNPAPALVFALFLAACGGDPKLLDLSAGRPNVVLILLDTFRADHLGCYGNDLVQTPRIDEFARESILFENASANAPWTLPSVASLYTGRLPFEHGVVGGTRQLLGRSTPTLAEHLRQFGYANAAYVGVDWLGTQFGLNRGFDQLVQRFGGPVSLRSERILPAVYDHLRAGPARPHFLLVHIFDAHAPYAPPAPFDRMYYQGDPTDPTLGSAAVLYSSENRIQSDPEDRYRWLKGVTDLQFPVRQYAAGISHVDHTVGALLDSLETHGELENSLIILTADHGEHLTEHDIYFTHRFPYEECLRVPLLVRLPGAREAGRRVSEEVTLVDVFPTLVELLGVTPIDAQDGRSLVPLMRGRRGGPERLHYAEYGAAETELARAVWDQRYRLVELRRSGGRSYELYDRRRDRAETENLAGRKPDELKRLAIALHERFGASNVVAEELGAPIDRGPIDAEVEARLRALGYLD